MDQVILLCGAAGSGKSTRARRLADEGYAVLSFDAEAWRRGHRVHPLPVEATQGIHERLKDRLVELVGEGRCVVVDTSFWARATREEYRELLAPLGVVPVVLYLDTPREVILDRLARREGGGPDDVVVTSEQAIAYLDGFEVPTADEGPLQVEAGLDLS
ncbi:AAA family ATPase [Salana multivorans]